MSAHDKPLVWLSGEVKTPPFSAAARLEAGFLLRCLQQAVALTMPQSRPMPDIGPRVAELRITDGAGNREWRLIYRSDSDAIVIADVFVKKTQKTPKGVIEQCKKRLADYDGDAER